VHRARGASAAAQILTPRRIFCVDLMRSISMVGLDEHRELGGKTWGLALLPRSPPTPPMAQAQRMLTHLLQRCRICISCVPCCNRDPSVERIPTTWLLYHSIAGGAIRGWLNNGVRRLKYAGPRNDQFPKRPSILPQFQSQNSQRGLLSWWVTFIRVS
jgi:hypothetical protein